MSKPKNIISRTRSYFLKAGFERLLQSIWRRYSGLEKVGGHAVVRKATMEECEAINSFMGWNKHPDSTIKVPLLQFEQELQESAFACTITELHERLYGETLLTKSERTLVDEQAWQSLFDIAEQSTRDSGKELASAVLHWLDALRSGKMTAGYRTVLDLWGQAAELAKIEIVNVVRAWNILLNTSGQGQPAMRLPVLAAIATGNPHALDRNIPAGRLFFQGLRFSQGKQEDDQVNASENNFEIDGSTIDSLRAREIYRAAGILDDDVSSLVHLYIRDQDLDSSPYVMTLRQVESARELPVISDIYVMENPAIFSTLVDFSEQLWNVSEENNTLEQVKDNHLLMCISGPASAAALKLIDRYVHEIGWNGKLYYSGDFDIKGIEIGNVLAGRYPQYFLPWRFDAESYLVGIEASKSGSVRFTSDELVRLETTEATWDTSLSVVCIQYGSKLFQEQIILQLIEDWERANRP